ncbi:tRNA (adenosine(37)-N6)-threonylcarbamoyltransferase complex ATPase subunit type 1 TsaE [Desulfovibrio sp.]|uniref:tRNA (adenosine(37)-N6)-threonylcarbamoyltransferase complex ATPase subunit type 1 TsaE n=1 Tax=Desulfovibrio sp. TaxID=885 RepID=UPI0023CB233B|nr:tRNA (adenosine(37)-N6)-threonylcarbamoyltransferase complex ATPase subunit type 1 TsaE [Desulfovibrio sp.]MDE7240687.1 tRNA (adenosine(37)-N6)-threonylcarbamoyltransferase complex ATPase subunit type 1 TsaE [Desulfovibrio sp.]
MAMLKLATLEATRNFGALLARLLPASGVRAILLSGGLGSGMITLTAALARALPGGEEAEVASPSFTLCNIYPTLPPLVHCDLYRAPGHAPEELLDALDADDALAVVEWADSLDPAALPDDFLDISLKMVDDGRLLLLKGAGPRGAALAAAVARAMERDPSLPQAGTVPRNG